jgi:uncharacterized protein (DUF433 family)
MLLGDILADLDLATRDQVDAALEHQRAHGGYVGAILVAFGAITSEQLMAALRVQQELTVSESDLALTDAA